MNAKDKARLKALNEKLGRFDATAEKALNGLIANMRAIKKMFRAGEERRKLWRERLASLDHWDPEHSRVLNEGPRPPLTVKQFEAAISIKERRRLEDRRAQYDLQIKLYEELGRKLVAAARRTQEDRGDATRTLILETERALKAKNPRLSAGDIAKHLGVNRSTVTRHLAKARKTS